MRRKLRKRGNRRKKDVKTQGRGQIHKIKQQNKETGKKVSQDEIKR
jgi:hypothetical protein